MRQRSWGRVSEVRVYWDIQNVGGEVMEGESARMIRNVSKISEEQRFCEFMWVWRNMSCILKGGSPLVFVEGIVTIFFTLINIYVFISIDGSIDWSIDTYKYE